MPHQAGWIELYSAIEEGKEFSKELVELCKSSRTKIVGETMLHWYSIEGEPDVLQKLIDLGFEINTQNKFGHTPIMESSLIKRWDNVMVLLENGADLTIENNYGDDYFAYLKEFGIQLPQHLVDWIELNYLS